MFFFSGVVHKVFFGGVRDKCKQWQIFFLTLVSPVVTIQVRPGSKLFIQLILLKQVKYFTPHFYIMVFFLKGEGLFGDTVKEVRYLWVIFQCSPYSNITPDMLKIHSKRRKEKSLMRWLTLQAASTQCTPVSRTTIPTLRYYLGQDIYKAEGA